MYNSDVKGTYTHDIYLLLSLSSTYLISSEIKIKKLLNSSDLKVIFFFQNFQLLSCFKTSLNLYKPSERERLNALKFRPSTFHKKGRNRIYTYTYTAKERSSTPKSHGIKPTDASLAHVQSFMPSLAAFYLLFLSLPLSLSRLHSRDYCFFGPFKPHRKRRMYARFWKKAPARGLKFVVSSPCFFFLRQGFVDSRHIMEIVRARELGLRRYLSHRLSAESRNYDCEKEVCVQWNWTHNKLTHKGWLFRMSLQFRSSLYARLTWNRKKNRILVGENLHMCALVKIQWYPSISRGIYNHQRRTVERQAMTREIAFEEFVERLALEIKMHRVLSSAFRISDDGIFRI